MTMLKRLFLTIMLAVAFAGRAAAADAATKPDAWFPLSPGAAWEYKATTTTTVAGGAPSSADVTVKLSAPAEPNGPVMRGDFGYAAKDDGVYLIGRAADKKFTPFDEPQRVVPAAPKTGDRWTYREAAGRTAGSCLGPETVKVPAGEYECQKVYLITIGGRDGAYRRETTRWFAKDVGLVKEVETTPAADGAVRETTTELTAYTPAKSAAAVATTPGDTGKPASPAVGTGASADALFAAAQAAARRGDHNSALRDYDAALAADPKAAKVHAYKTLSLIAVRQLDAADAEIAQALAADPKDYTFQEIAGQLKIAQGQVKEGKALYNKAATLSPPNAGAVYTDLAAALAARNDERLAGDIDAALKSAANATPPSAPALFALGQSYANAGRAEAKPYLQRYVEVATALPKEQRDEQKIRLAKQLIRAIDLVKGAR
jgi:Flp pilus assembly protein TadD